MSSHHHLGPNPPNGDVEHIYSLSEQIGALCLNGEYSDVVLLVEDQKFHAHKVILAARSEYFRALLYGGMRESQQSEIELKGSSIEAFKGLLHYIYTGHMSLGRMKEEAVLDVLGLAHQYGFVDLEDAVSEYLRQILRVRNVCLIFDAARLYQLQFLSTVCFSFMDRHAFEILHQDGFFSLSPVSLRELVSRDSFCAPESEIFQAVVRWVQQNPEEDSSAALSTVRLPLMDLKDLLNVVRPTGLVSSDFILDAIQARTESKDTELQYRGYMVPDENVAHPKHGTQVLQGEMRSALLDGDITNYDMERGYTRHAITVEGGDMGILIKLGMPCIINHMKMLLWDRDLRSYCYYIEVSMDQKDWIRVIDHTQFYCRSWQYLYFVPRVVQYIRIVGTNNTVNKVFHVVSYEAMYVNTQFQLDKGLVVPSTNVATIEQSASVIEGVSRSRNALLNGDTKDYDWDSGYTCHQLGSGSIIVQLGQPYMLDSMRLLLWDCDPRSYSYYVQTSVNGADWTVVSDKTREACRSWQTIKFKRQPVVFVRIVGMHNTANEVFHVVHFECPAQVPAAAACPPMLDAAAACPSMLETTATCPPMLGAAGPLSSEPKEKPESSATDEADDDSDESYAEEKEDIIKPTE